MAQQMTQPKETTILTGKRLYILILMFTMTVINYVDRVNLSVAGPAIAKEFHLDPVQMGWLFSAFLWTYVLFLIPTGRLIDTWGTRKVVAVAISVWSLAAMATGLVNSLGTMIVARLGLGTGESPGIPVQAKIVRQWFPARERGLATAGYHAGGYFGPAIGPPFVAWLIVTWGWRASFVICGAVGFVWLLFWLKFFRLPEDTTWLPEAERRYILETRDGVKPAAPVTTQDAPPGFGTVLRTLFSQKVVWGLFLAQGFGNYAAYMFMSWLPTYLIQYRGMQFMKAGFISGLPFLIAVFLSPTFAKICDASLSPEGIRQGKRRNWVCLFLLLSTVVLLTNVVTSSAAVVIVIGLSATFNVTVLSLNVALTNDLIDDPRMAGSCFSITLLGGNSFGLIAPIVTGYIVKATGGFAGAFALAGVLVIVGAVCSFTLTRGRIHGPEKLVAQGAGARP